MAGSWTFPVILRCCAVLLASTTGVVAQDNAASCVHAPAIVATADFLLRERADPPRFWRDFESTDAAFLKIRYGSLDYSVARRLIGSLEQRSKPPQRIGELSLAHATAADRAAAIAALAPDPAGSVLLGLGTSTWRALVQRDGGDWLVEELVRWRGAKPDSPQLGTFLSALPNALAGIGDDALSALSERARDAGFDRTALELLSLRSNLSGALKFVDELPDASDKTARAQHLRRVLQIAMLNPDLNPAIQPDRIKEAILASTSWRLFRPIALLADRIPDAILVATLLNQTGEQRIGTDLAVGMLEAFAKGSLDPARQPDAAMAELIDRLAAILGRQRLEAALRGFQLPFDDGSDDRTALAFADTVLARAALAGYVAGKAGEAPSRPVAMSAGFDWERWGRIATLLAKGQPVADADQVIAASILDAAGKPGPALQALRLAEDQDGARSLARRMAQRLDRRCADLLGHPLPFMEPIYRFE